MLPPDDEDDPWQAAVADVRPLGQARRRWRTTKPLAPAAATPATVYPRPRHPATLVIHSHNALRLSGSIPGLEPGLLKRLAAGAIAPTARLDLHGLREGDAWLRLMTWLEDAVRHDHRCVLVITGKGQGYGQDGSMGIIRAQAPYWLAAHPQVMAFHTALAEDGGAGAIYVYLRRVRS